MPALPGPAIVEKQPGVMRVPTPAAVAGIMVPEPPRPVAQRTATTFDPSTLFGAPAADMATRVRERRHAERFKKFVGMLLVLCVAAGGVFAWTKFRPKQEYPATWDARVLPLVQFVETNREMGFEHPVAIEFLEPAAYQERLRADSLDVDDDEREQAEYQQELLDLFGLTATYNLLEDRGTIESLASLGFYSTNSDSIVIRGEGLTPGVRTTVVHELTHALQAQHFDTNARIADRSTRSVAEADAMEVEQAYLNTLPDAEKWTAVQETKMTPADEQLLATVPETLVELEYAPYRLGRLAMDRRHSAGNAGINEALTRPPTEKQMIAPWATEPEDTAGLTATAPAGATIVEENQPLSLVELLVMLDAWLPWSLARPSLDAWRDGVFTTYRTSEDGPLCAALHVSLYSPGGYFASAVSWWSAAMGEPVTPAVDGNDVQFTLCARGKGAPEPPRAVVPTTVAVEVELSIVPGALIPAAGASPQAVVLPPDQAPSAGLGDYLCVARTVVDDAQAAPLLTLPLPTADQQAVIDARIDAAIATCLP